MAVPSEFRHSVVGSDGCCPGQCCVQWKEPAPSCKGQGCCEWWPPLTRELRDGACLCAMASWHLIPGDQAPPWSRQTVSSRGWLPSLSFAQGPMPDRHPLTPADSFPGWPVTPRLEALGKWVPSGDNPALPLSVPAAFLPHRTSPGLFS